MSANPRLMRTELLLGEDGIRRLQQACVMIVGLGDRKSTRLNSSHSV